MAELTAQPAATPIGEPSAESSPAAPRPEGMLLVPAGQSIMGADQGGEPDEHPAHATA